MINSFLGYAPRENFGGPPKLPEKPPYTAHLGNLSYDATNDTVNEFFAGCEIISVRIIEDREQMRPKGFAYAEFATVDGLKKALELDGENFQGRTIRVKIADPREFAPPAPPVAYHDCIMTDSFQLATMDAAAIPTVT